MLGVLCSRTKPWILSSITSFICRPAAPNHLRFSQNRIQFHHLEDWRLQRRRLHSSTSNIGGSTAAASIWHALLPSGRCKSSRPEIRLERKGEGSWNVAWDARPARWLQRPDSDWFGVCSCLGPLNLINGDSDAVVTVEEKKGGCDLNESNADNSLENPDDFRVRGVLADGRCLFRAIAHCARLRKGEEAPDEDSQRELADELRAQVVDELIKRREESEWFIEDDFDAYIKRIREPSVWGGEPELLMASHVLKTKLSVFMRDRRSGRLANIANYGEEYLKDEESPISILFHGYGHYDILESC